MKKAASFLFSIVLLFVIGVTTASAATIAVTPATATITAGATFSVSVRVDTQGASVGVAEAAVTYPADLLELVATTNGSTFSVVTRGSPYRSEGKVIFSGTASEGYKGTNGILGRITFRVKAPGIATIGVSEGRILLNSATTNVFSGKTDAVITIPGTPAVTNQATPAPVLIAEPDALMQAPTSVTSSIPAQPQPSQEVPERYMNPFHIILILAGIIALLLFIIILLITLMMHERVHHMYEHDSSKTEKEIPDRSITLPITVASVPKKKRIVRNPRKPRSVEPV